MNIVASFLCEVRRILNERLTWLFMALTVTGAVWFCLNGTGRTASDAFMVSAAQNSAILGTFLFTLLCVMQFRRDDKNHTEGIVLTSTDPIHHQIRRTLALLCVAVVTTLIITLFALPYGMVKTGDYFQLATFLTAWGLIFLGALVSSVLLTAGFYMLTKRVEATFIIMVGLILLSVMLGGMYALNPSYLFYWVQTTAENFSDLITNQFQIDMIVWNRLFCLLAALGIWTLGLCSVRRYGRGLFGSLFVNSRRVWMPVFFVAMLLLSGFTYAFEPIFDDSKPMDFSGMISSGTGIVTSVSSAPEVGNPNLTLTEKRFDLDVDAKGRTLSGLARFKLSHLSHSPQTLPLKMNTGLNIDDVLVNGTEVNAIRGETGELSTANWSVELPAADEYEITLAYSGQIMNDNTILQKASNGISEGYVWLPAVGVSPSVDINVSHNASFSGCLSLDEKLEPVFAGGRVEKDITNGGKTKWRFMGDAGTQGTELFAAEYITSTFEAGGLTIEFKYFKKHEKSLTDMDAIKVIKATIDYFTEAYGPLIYSENLTMLELPAYASGGFAAGNMSAMDETNFNTAGYLPIASLTPDSGGGIDVLVHEIAHQWWGLATMPIQDGVSNWSAEGVTCYSTYCFMKQYYGEEYAQERFIKEWQNGWNTYRNAFYIQHPEYLTMLSDSDASSVMGAFVNMRLYDIMPLMLLRAEETLGGTETLQKGLSNLYLSHLGQAITYEDFLSATGLTKEAIRLA